MRAQVEPIDRLAIYDRDGGICHICGEYVEREVFELDHLWPLSRGGRHTPDNLAVAHRSCNASKGNRWGQLHVVYIPVELPPDIEDALFEVAPQDEGHGRVIEREGWQLLVVLLKAGRA